MNYYEKYIKYKKKYLELKGGTDFIVGPNSTALDRINREIPLIKSEMPEVTIISGRADSDSINLEINVDEFIVSFVFSNLYPLKCPKIMYRHVTNDIFCEAGLTDLRKVWGPEFRITDILEEILSKNILKMSYKFLDDKSLFVGAHPSEKTDGRRIFSEPNVYFMDFSDEKIPDDFDPTRFIKLDFRNIEMLRECARNNFEKFETICFDYSVWKFLYVQNDPDKIDKLNCFNQMLKQNGTFVIAHPIEASVSKINPDEVINGICEDLSIANYKCYITNKNEVACTNELFKFGTAANIKYVEHLSEYVEKIRISKEENNDDKIKYYSNRLNLLEQVIVASKSF